VAKFTAELTNRDDGGLLIEAFADGVSIYRWGMPGNDRPIAQRLVKAIVAGAIFEPHEAYTLRVREAGTDRVVQIPAGWRSRILARKMNAELRRLGF
jgi:hypothetical protein